MAVLVRTVPFGRSDRVLFAGAALLLAMIFAADAQVPLGSAVGMLYMPVIMLGLWTRWRHYALTTAVLATLLVVADAVIGWSPAVPAMFYVNRPLMVLMFFITAGLVTKYTALQRLALAHVEQLADFTRALDAAAIVATTDVTGRITYVNDKFVEISGYSREELLGQDHRLVNSSHHSKEFIRSLWRTIAGGHIWHGEIRNRAKQGHYYWVDTTIVPFLNSAGKPYQYIAIRWNITPRKAALDRLANLKAALDHAAIVASTDVSGRITDVNDKFVEISGYSREELLGQDHRIINSAYHPKEFIRHLWRTIASGRVWHGELRNRAKDGRFYWVDTTIVPLLDERGKPYQYIAIRADITARKAAEEKLAQQAALARVGQMAAVVAHEVRNPLAGVKGAIQILISRRAPGDAELPVMRDIVARIDALSELINDLMVFARPRPPRLSVVDLHGLIAEAIAIVRRDPAAHDVDISVHGASLSVTADGELVRAMLLNLLLNAAQAMAMAGRGGRLAVAVSERHGMAIIEVRDTGPGVPPEIRSQIFEPFFTTKSRGGGLGLPIARRTAELHGGALTFECPPDGGTIVTVELPIRPPVTSAPAAPGEPDQTVTESDSTSL